MAADAPTGSEGTATAELWVRSLGQLEAVEQQTELVDRLARLEKAGVLGGVDVDVWGSRLVLSAETARTAPGRRFLTRYQRFQDWAERVGATLEPFFETTEAVSSFTGAEHTLLVLPVNTLAEFDGDEVVHVAPSVVDGEVRTVQDRLAVLEARAGEESMPRDGETVPGEGETVPREVEMVSGDGEAVPRNGRTVPVSTGAATRSVAERTDEQTTTADGDGTGDPEQRVGNWSVTLMDPTVRKPPDPGRTDR